MDCKVAPRGRGSTRSLLLLDQRASLLRDNLTPCSSSISPHRIQFHLPASSSDTQLDPVLLLPSCNPSSRGERASKVPHIEKVHSLQEAPEFVLPIQASFPSLHSPCRSSPPACSLDCPFLLHTEAQPLFLEA